ncbi:hypothetical protein ABIF35_006639 [Bradyrhizobium japonicum]
MVTLWSHIRTAGVSKSLAQGFLAPQEMTARG